MCAFSEWIEDVRQWLCYVTVYKFSSSYEEIKKGTYKTDLFDGTFHENSVKIMRKAMVEFVFNAKPILVLELSSQTILSFLLNKFVNAIIYYDSEQDEKVTKADKKYINLISQNYKKNYESSKREKDDSFNLYLRILMVTDYISGMTDTYARTLYRELSGIE